MSTGRRSARFRLVLCLAVFIVCGLVPRAATAETPCERSDDSVWLIVTRGLNACREPAPSGYQVAHRNADGEFVPATLADVVAEGADDVPIVVFVHGNRVRRGSDQGEGMRVYQSLARVWDPRQPLRFVIWSWPSSQIRGPLRDIRSKAARTDFESYLLGKWLTTVPETTPVGLIGYSFGARIVAGAVHLASGEALAGRTLVPADHPLPPMHVVLAAAALHNYWLAPNGRWRGVWRPSDVLLNLFNHRDPALKHYALIEKGGRPQALGYTGISRRSLKETESDFRQWDVAPIVGRSHQWTRYFGSRKLVRLMRDAIVPDGSDRP